MSEVTYKKIVDVEQIDTLGEGTTLFVNDGGSMKQMGAAALGAVKSVNGVLPDENGEVKATELIQFADYSAIIPGRILYGGTYTMQEIVNKLFNGEHQRYEVVISILNPMNGIQTDRKVTAYETIVTGDDRLLTGVKLYYGDEACPIILDGVNNTITLDPDWVKPEESVQPDWNQNDPNAADYVKNRTHWSEIKRETVVEETTITGANGQFTVISALKTDGKYIVNYNGTEYECMPKTDPSGDLALGNLSIAKSTLENTGEPFLLTGMSSAGAITYALFADRTGAHVFAAFEVVETVHPLDPKYLPEDHINGMIDSKLVGAGGGGAKQVIFDATIDDESGEYVATCNCTFEEVLQAATNGNAALLRYQSNIDYGMVNHNVIRLCECGYTLAKGDAEDMIVIGCGFSLIGNAVYGVTMSMDGEIQVTIN